MPKHQRHETSKREDADEPFVLELDLNSAAEEELAGLPALGPERARAVVQFRPFDYWTDLRRIPGFSAGVIGELKDSGVRLEPCE